MAKPLTGISLQNLKVSDVLIRLRSQDRKTLIQAGIIGGAVIVFLFLLFLPILGQNKRLMAENKNLKMMIEEARTRTARIPDMKEQKEVYGARIRKMRDEFFEAEDKDELIKIISTVAGGTKVQISASKPSAKDPELPQPFGEQYEPVSFELNAEGPYHELGLFLNGLERYEKNFSIFDLQIKKKEREESMVLASTFALTAFLKRPPGARQPAGKAQFPDMVPGMEGMAPEGYPPPRE